MHVWFAGMPQGVRAQIDLELVDFAVPEPSLDAARIIVTDRPRWRARSPCCLPCLNRRVSSAPKVSTNISEDMFGRRSCRTRIWWL